MSISVQSEPGGRYLAPRPKPSGLNFACSVEHHTHQVVMYLHGELDLATAPELRRRLLGLITLPVGTVTLDMAGLSFIDAQGLHVLSAAHQAAAAHQVTFAVQGVSRLARQLLELTGMTHLLDIRDASNGHRVGN